MVNTVDFIVEGTLVRLRHNTFTGEKTLRCQRDCLLIKTRKIWFEKTTKLFFQLASGCEYVIIIKPTLSIFKPFKYELRGGSNDGWSSRDGEITGLL